ncbi:hypothetical protein [Saccharothrix obliqua]|uniref:hypothetical protein n=1 Tax=Saccharothrix obliqua TaxID=2861747 RepID=UPI001C5D9C8C|nr:hypothetical protein [Saccharothrix obliqua]MBW4720558.1 hypothetical protein [Saccharothrix obliqua]
MQLYVRFRLGGPERAAAAPVVLRRALRAGVADLVVPGLDELDLLITPGGSITAAEGDGGVHAVRFSAARRRLTANVVVPASEIDAASAPVAPAAHLAELARRVAARCAPDRVEEVRAALGGAFRDAVARAA